MRRNHISILILTLMIVLPSSFALSGEITNLAKKALRLNMWMSRQEVISLLGRPTWAVIPSDGGDFALVIGPDPGRVKLDLYWKNTPCFPVIVSFNSAYRVIGWDGGQTFCGQEWRILKPLNEYSCGKADRANFCK